MKIVSMFALTALTFVGIACSDGSSPRATDATSAPPTTDAPETDPPPTSPPATDPAVADPEVPANPVEVDDGGFETIQDLTDSAELVVVGTVTDESSLGRPVETNDPSADEYLGLTISVESVLKGDPVAEVLLGWDAYVLDAAGQRIAANVMNGIPVPHVGDRLVLFLRPVDDQFASLLHGFPTHTPVGLDGIGFVEDGTVTITDRTAPSVAHLADKTVEEIEALLSL